ncbi:MAG: hypothetical protein Q4D98_09610 [Planctomycetia bacterium]|nr:hypothetical protein [Planctomycetia bacterium]
MKRNICIVVLLAVLWGVSGCKLGGSRGKTTTDWSLPSVKLPSAKKGDSIARPADRANAKATAELAHDRQAGHNPAAAADGEDPSLRPNPAEVAELSRFEGGDVPAWATQGAAPPEAVASQEKTTDADTVIPSIDTSNTPSANVGNLDALASGLPPITEEGGLPTSLDGGLPSTIPSDAVASDVPASLPTEAATYPQTGNLPSLGSSVSELPGNVTPAQAVVPAQATTTTATTTDAQPAVLFAPGNINPSYPASAPASGTLDATSTAPAWR